MAVNNNKPMRPAGQRPAQKPGATQTPPATRSPAKRVSTGIIKTARDIFVGKAPAKVIHRSDAKFVEGRPTNDTGASNQQSSFDHVAFLDGFLARLGKVRGQT